MRIIGENGENLGIMSREDALRLASPESGLDLIEVVAKADPPVARLMSYDKYRYEREKAEKKERKAHKFAEMKRVQISARAAENDLLTKIKQLEKFLTEGHQVEVFVRLRGREKYNRDWANKKLTEFLQMIKMEYKVLGAPKFAQGLSIQIAKK